MYTYMYVSQNYIHYMKMLHFAWADQRLLQGNIFYIALLRGQYLDIALKLGQYLDIAQEGSLLLNF